MSLLPHPTMSLPALLTSALATLLCLGSGPLQAKASPEEISQLGKQLTCIGAQKAGTPSGVAEYSGKWLGAAPGMQQEADRLPSDPYAAEKPLYTITAANLAQYADKLSEGQKALFRKYPSSFRMSVYPSHRDFRYDDAICQVIAKNAANAELAADGLSVINGHMGASPFPLPKNGQELLWNAALPAMTHVEYRDTDLAIVYPNGNITWGAQKVWVLARANDPQLRGQPHEGLAVMARAATLLPEREKGLMTRVIDKFTMGKEARLAWQYIPATRRVRQAPGFGFDMPMASSANTLTIDDARIFNGSGERYDWKLLGKREIHIPYNNYRLESRSVGDNKYAALLTPNHENPDLVRWELHRVWVLEARLKDGFRHLYPHRVFYIDEDSWLFTMADTYDAQGNIWKFNWLNNVYQPGPNVFNQFSAFYHDLSSGAYTVYDLSQGKPQGMVVDAPKAEYSKPGFYSIDNLKVSGY
ncbi:MAG: DUF1329 domain-containing protein [Sterolibacterium sp.]|nr:DUF1329 domain-containing protein [Sterolibacterium sp.]